MINSYGQCVFNNIKFTDADVINPQYWVAEGEDNLDGTMPWLLHDHGFVLAVVFAYDEDDAIEVAAAAGKLTRYLVSPEELKDYNIDQALERGLRPQGDGYADYESLSVIALPNPRRPSFCQAFGAQYCSSTSV